MAEKAVGLIILSINGEEYDCSSYNATKNTGKRPIPTMNRSGEVKYTANGIKTYQVTVAVVIPDSKDTMDWLGVDDARLNIESQTGTFRESYIDFNVQEISDSYEVNGETRRNLQGFALSYLNETL
ncbi:MULTISPECIES: hypothetical protein [Acinetobacter]|uniref:Phage tail protein n=1 Tax=Acinetobacter ursingii TaxID=108980 RepID=A0A7T9UGA7_9GAMM|nr:MULTISPECIES: hypothetical protein [Acinetobacter]ENX46643.1 hypothetical protein F943_02984 [Acinetobacter ursingii NIPH 706]EXD35761.1 hypothetical protein J500_1887 [Acinetobacter sp. 479375]MCU4524653.1 hypothetical protein [Acinetobacter ursingii]QQT85217.1 hypothetical protein I6I53_09730 [Acinetobacter ursingii]RSO82872.1 hypothetical protein EA748_07915 [Acinetobacter ursingii]